MYNICIFAGTTEGRKLVEFLSRQSVSVMACVATEYGEMLLPSAENLTVSAKRLTRDEMTDMMKNSHYDLVIDATHPYAEEVTEHIEYAARVSKTEYLRLLRADSEMTDEIMFMPDIASAVNFLNKTDGNIFVTTGSKELTKYAGIHNFAERVYARVLPTEASLEACRNVGLKPAHTIAMQGPFSQEMNVAVLHMVSAKYLITKDGGETGGFNEKIDAALKTGAVPIVIGRPPQKKGLSYSEVTDLLHKRFGCVPCVTILGIGPGNRDAMTAEAITAIKNADCIIGAKRMLEVSNGQRVYEAISPNKIAEFIISHKEYKNFAVVMSGDTGFFSGTKKLLPLLNECDVNVLPGLSSLSYLCSKLKISYEDVSVISLHGREHDIIRDIRANSHIFVMMGGKNGVKNLCKTMISSGLGGLKTVVGEKLSYADEKITIGNAEKLADGEYDALSVVLIENDSPNEVVTHGLPDNVFRRETGEDGVVPMTKSEVRSVCLSKLRLTERAICWDIGAGSGSVAVEMALQARKGWVYAIEKKESALQLLKDNMNKLSVKNMTAVNGTAPQICDGLPVPTHVFVGGSSGNMKSIIAMLIEKNPNVRIVATAISLETIAELTECMKIFDFTETEVVSMNISRGRYVGKYSLMTGQNPVYIFTMQNGGKEK